MPFPVSFMSANFVGRQAGWHFADSSAGDRATNAWDAALATSPNDDFRILDDWLEEPAA